LIEQFTLSRLKLFSAPKSFDCTDKELNEFLYEDAVNYSKALLAITYLLQKDAEIVGYFSVLNDSIRHESIPSQTPSKGELRRLLKRVPFKKRRYKSHPAVKVGRLAVDKEYQSSGIGTELMDYIKGYFLDNNKTGCRFVTVDANNNERTIKFYINNGFDFLTEKDKDEPSRLMYFDLIRYANYMNSL
jgi:GNAT superfamily N-acetyltransferase